MTDEEYALVYRRMAFDATDVFVAFDPATGRVVWQAEEVGKGVNRFMGKRSGYNCTPAYRAGGYSQ